MTEDSTANADTETEVAERLNVALIPEAVAALARLREHTSMSRVDLINRAIQVYDFVEAEKRAGKRIAVVDPGGSVEEVTWT